MKKIAVLILSIAIMPMNSFAAPSDCISCHREKTPGAVRQWEASAHFKAGVGCEKCHGADHEKMVKGEARVDLKVCGKCHEKALRDHTASRHGMALHSGWGCTRNMSGRNAAECRFCHEDGSSVPEGGVQCARFLKQSSEMGVIGCNYCHNVEISCASCHTNHNTSLSIVRDPNSCAKCHMGPDHPQWEMWQTSLHGTLNATAGIGIGPTCQTCHMPQGTHNVSIGITMTSGGAPYSPQRAEPARKEMLKICNECHSPEFGRKELARGDAVRSQSLSILKEAENIIWDMSDHGLLDPMPDKRPAHPLSGSKLVTDNQMLYEDTSHIERLFFKMKKFDYARTIKGAYHQNPAYAHWYGNAELKMDLIDIKSEASRLRERGNSGRAGSGAGKPAGPGASAEEALRALKSKADRGALSAGEYAREKAKILERISGK